MKKKIYSVFVLTSIFILILNIFLKTEVLTKSIIFSSNLFIKNIMPSLFPMFVISGILVSIGMPEFLGSIFNRLFNKIFKTKGEISFIFFMSMITGFPSSAKYIKDLINKKLINEQDANKALMFTFFSNPLFIINTVGLLFYKDIIIGIYILICHIISNIITGILFRNYNKNYDIKIISKKEAIYKFYKKINTTNFFNLLLNSIKNSIEDLINIFGVVTFSIILINIFFTPDNLLKIGLIGLLEMTTGLKYISSLDLSLNLKVILSGFLISFGGFSVHMQIMSILKEKKIKYLPFLISRIISCLITSILLYMLF